MNKRNRNLLMLSIILFSGSLSYRTFTVEKPKAATTAAVPTQQESSFLALVTPTQIQLTQTLVEVEEPFSIDSKFPLPGDGKDFTKSGDGGINFQTGMKIEDVINFTASHSAHRDDLSENCFLCPTKMF